MRKYILDVKTKLDEVFLKSLFLDKRALFCVVNAGKVLGVISRGDLERFLSGAHDADYKSITAYEISNKKFLKFHIESLESEILNFFAGKHENIHYIPIVDSQDNLITIVAADAITASTDWAVSQKYEFHFWDQQKDMIQWIKQAQNIFETKTKADSFRGYNSLLVNNLVAHIENKHVLEIGCGPVCGYLPYMWFAKERIAIEPLLEKYALFWNEIGMNMDEIINIKYSIGADIFIPELAGKIDGLIFSCNALDHTPNWPFVLSNISSYAAAGSYLYLWTDIQHVEKPDVGHYNITPNGSNIYRMIENLGYEILETKTNTPLPLMRNNLFVELLAVKTRHA